MSLPEFVVAIWHKPHRGYGYFAEIDASLVEDGLPGGVLQNFKDVRAQQRAPELHPEHKHHEFRVTAAQVTRLVQLADQITYAFAEHPYSPRLDCPSLACASRAATKK